MKVTLDRKEFGLLHNCMFASLAFMIRFVGITLETIGTEDGLRNAPFQLLAMHQVLKLWKSNRDIDDGGSCLQTR